MRWRVPKYEIPDWLVWVLFWWALIPLLATILLAIVLPSWLEKKKRARFGPYWDRWQQWFAWRPVRLSWWDNDDHAGQWRWLERVERRLPQYASWGMRYRPAIVDQSPKGGDACGSIHASDGAKQSPDTQPKDPS